MKVAVPVAEKDRGSSGLHGHFSTAPYFLVYDTENGTTEILDNHELRHEHGGCPSLNALVDLKVTGIIVSGIGGRSIERLTHLGITVFQALPGTISENLEALKMGRLAKFSVERSCSHRQRAENSGH